ncbi:hypothetical protein AAVH_08409 [Aphelenchoides avenae]|nr:hypothetical protein AAVH_08409 [Aphelenchus avenae]
MSDATMLGVFAFLRRWQIDGCQLVCKHWFAMIEECADVLPLHPLQHWRLSAFYGCRFNCRAHDPCPAQRDVRMKQTPGNCVHTRTTYLRLRHERRTIQLLTDYGANDVDSPNAPTRQMGKSRRIDSLLRWPELFYHARNAYVEDLSLCYRTVPLGLFEAVQRFLAVDGKVRAARGPARPAGLKPRPGPGLKGPPGPADRPAIT